MPLSKAIKAVSEPTPVILILVKACSSLVVSPRLTKLEPGRAKDTAYPNTLFECLLRAPSRQDIGTSVSQQEPNANFTCTTLTLAECEFGFVFDFTQADVKGAILGKRVQAMAKQLSTLSH